MSDKRKFTRLPDHLSISYRIISLGDTPEGYIDLRGGGVSDNISEGGALFEVLEEIPLGSFLEISFIVPDLDYPLILRGRVVRVEEIIEGKKYDIGLKFTQIFEKDRELLQKHLTFLMDKILQ